MLVRTFKPCRIRHYQLAVRQEELPRRSGCASRSHPLIVAAASRKVSRMRKGIEIKENKRPVCPIRSVEQGTRYMHTRAPTRLRISAPFPTEGTHLEVRWQSFERNLKPHSKNWPRTFHRCSLTAGSRRSRDAESSTPKCSH